MSQYSNRSRLVKHHGRWSPSGFLQKFSCRVGLLRPGYRDSDDHGRHGRSVSAVLALPVYVAPFSETHSGGGSGN